MRKTFYILLMTIALFPLFGGGIGDLIDSDAVHGAAAKNYPYKWDLAAAMIFRDDAPYLKEWVEYYKLIGFDHLFLYNNLSVDHYLEILEPYIRSGFVELTEWPYESYGVSDWDNIQVSAYYDAWQKSIGKVKWLAIVDSDEFFLPVQDYNLKKFLERYENKSVGAVVAYWVVFGTSHIEKIPDDRLMIEMLTLNGGGVSDHFKTICRPERTISTSSPHHVTLKTPYVAKYMNADTELRVNHYWSRDEYFLHNFKIPMREKWGTSRETTLAWSSGANYYSSLYSETILKYVPQLQKNMGFTDE